jgi:hypothetical protein
MNDVGRIGVGGIFEKRPASYCSRLKILKFKIYLPACRQVLLLIRVRSAGYVADSSTKMRIYSSPLLTQN